MTPVLELRGLTVALGAGRDHPAGNAVQGVSLAIAPGEVLGLVGESGAGKSSLGSAVAGLLPRGARIADGEIWLEGVRVDNSPALLRPLRGRRIGVTVQDTASALDPLRTIGFQLAETIRTHLGLRAEAAEAAAIEWLGRVGLPAPHQLAAAYPHELSGGMRQRVVVALALCAGPTLVIADEPTAALDSSVQARIVGMLRKYATERPAAVLLVTHDMGVVAEAADRIAVLYAGRIVEIGPVRDVLVDPAHPYTRGLIGSIPPLGRRLARLQQIDGTMPRPDDIPPGCPFASGCPEAFARCRTERPPSFKIGRGEAACWLHDPLVSRRREHGVPARV